MVTTPFFRLPGTTYTYYYIILIFDVQPLIRLIRVLLRNFEEYLIAIFVVYGLTT